MTVQRVVVIGAGMGGLACAARLAAAGRDVVLVEAAAGPGGKLREVMAGGLPSDAGPTVFTMRWVFDELFADCGASFSDQVALTRAHTLASHRWAGADGRVSQLELFASLEQSADAVGNFAGATEAGRFRAFHQRAQQIYHTLEPIYIRGSRPTPLGMFRRAGWRGTPALLRISPFATLWRALGGHFTDPRLRQLFGRYATYCGSSPFQAPATLMLIAHVEQEGLWLVDGGMHRLATAMAQLASACGATLRYGQQVRSIDIAQGRVTGVLLQMPDGSTERLAASQVVFNGDAGALAQGLLGDGARSAAPAPAAAGRSLSALTWNVLTDTGGQALQRHNVLFSNDYTAEFAHLFSGAAPPAHPTVYLCAQDRDPAGRLARPGPERLLALVNAPANSTGAAWSAERTNTCTGAAQAQLARCGLRLAPGLAHATTTTPDDFARLFPGTGGALYGLPSHSWLASFRRPGARSAVAGLYLAGGSAHPGPGVPMATLSGQQAALSVLEDQP